MRILLAEFGMLVAAGLSIQLAMLFIRSLKPKKKDRDDAKRS